MRGGLLERLGAAGGDAHVVLPGPQVNPQRPQDLRLIVNNKHPCHGMKTP